MRFTPEILATLPTKRPPPDIPTLFTFYYTGEPCKNGHVAPRYVSTGGCTACLKRTMAKTRLPCPYMPPVALYASALVQATLRKQPELADAMALMLQNDDKTQEWLLARAQSGEAPGTNQPRVRYEAGPKPLDPLALAPTAKCLDAGLTLARMLQNGWTCEQLVREGYAELAEV